MKIIIVNDRDEVIGSKERESLDYSRDIYRVSALWIINDKGESLLAKRALTKKNHPGKWGPAAAGTVEEGESYESNIIKEAEEELGLKNIKLEKSINAFINGKYKHFTRWFFLKLSIRLEDLKMNTDEVAEIKWFGMKEILELVEKGMTTTFSNELLKEVKRRIKK